MAGVLATDVRFGIFRNPFAEREIKYSGPVASRPGILKIKLGLSDADIILTYDFLFPIHLPELRRGDAFLLLEDPVEVRQRVEPAFETDFGDGFRGVDELPGGHSEPDVDDVVRQATSGPYAEKAAECRGGHSGDVGQRRKPDVALEMGADILFDAGDAAGIGRGGDLCERAARQGVGLLRERQFVENFQNLEHLPESLLLGREGVDERIDLDDGAQRECEPVLGTEEHLLNGCELVFCEQRFGQGVGCELNGDFADEFRLTGTLFPDMGEVFASDEYEVVVSDCFDGISDDPFDAGAVFDEIEFEFAVLVQGVCEFGFVTFDDVEAVSVGERREFVEDVFSHRFGIGSHEIYEKNASFRNPCPVSMETPAKARACNPILHLLFRFHACFVPDCNRNEFFVSLYRT